SWLRDLNIARIGGRSFVAVGAAFTPIEEGAQLLLTLYVTGFAVGLLYLYALQTSRRVGLVQSWTQVLVDFAIVASTVAYTHGPSSFFTFVFVMVVLEAGLLLGLSQSIALASLASVFMLQQTVLYEPGARSFGSFGLWYTFLAQCLAFYLTATISGYWTQRLSRLQEFQREILDNLNSGFLITDADGNIAVQNQAARQILDLDGDKGVGWPVSEVLRVESGAECPVTTALRLGQDFASYEFRVRTETGESILLGLTTNCMRDSNGNITGVIASFTDLTEMSAMREELRQQDRLAVIGELAAGLAHEIRNPVAVIRGALEELSARDKDQPLRKKLQEIAIRESDHLNGIVSGFLNFARDPSVKRETIDAAALASEVAALLRREHHDCAGLRIELSTLEQPSLVSGDSTQIKQVFTNLGKNAVEAMHGEGTLRIEVSNGSGPVEIRFDDDGPGIDPDKIGRIFEPFYTTKESGVGMGLAVCLRIITAHDGTIMASSREGGGCSIKVLLPGAAQGKEIVS
ncbi:MAG: PAS domain-containing protein, partial [Candidatus Hydrogenedentes bacterium]|nr:PAS domain-containing protein [Candidatus Hydrogenedentota bacterium]